MTTVPHEDPSINRTHTLEAGIRKETLAEEAYFSVYHWGLDGLSKEIKPSTYQLMSVIQGSGEVLADGESFAFEKGDHLIIPATMDSFQLKGQATLIVSHSNKA